MWFCEVRGLNGLLTQSLGLIERASMKALAPSITPQ